ncbi:hypothetical protein [Parasutterella sp.]|uniref:hypothetical protein n=1 Tax=Parasutterella sp. TaxID=2049037 RepID=UPI00351FD742
MATTVPEGQPRVKVDFFIAQILKSFSGPDEISRTVAQKLRNHRNTGIYFRRKLLEMSVREFRFNGWRNERNVVKVSSSEILMGANDEIPLS